MAFFVHAFVVRANAANAIAIKQEFGARKSGEDGNTSLFHLAAEPLHESIERDDIVAMIAQRRWRTPQLELVLLRKKVNCLPGDFCIERRFFFEAGKQFAHGTRVEQRTR